MPYSGGFVPNFAKTRRSFSGESPVNIAKALIHGKSTAMNLNMGGGKRFADTWHSYAPAMATGNEMNSIRERIYKRFIQNKGGDFRGEVNKALKNIGGKSVEKWGTGGVQDDLVYGMVEQLNSARKSSRKLELPYSGGFVPNFAKGGRGLPSQMNAEDRAMYNYIDDMNASYRNPGPKKYFTPKVSSGRTEGKRFRDLSPSMMEKAAMMYWKSGYMKPDKPIPPHLFPHTLIPKNMFGSLRIDKPKKWDMSTSGGFVPNFGMRLNANKIKSIGKGKIHSDKFDGTIGMKELDNILTTGLFKSLNYTSKAGNDLTYTNARWGVNKYKKGAPPPGNYVSYGEMDKATGTRSMWIGSTGEGADAFRKLKLKKISSLVSQGKHLKVDPNMANSGFVPNYSAFHYDKNIEKKILKGGQNKFTPTPVQMLEFMTEKQLTAAMEKYIKHSLDPSIGFEFKGSYPGMPIKEFKNHFPVGDIYKGLDILDNKRMGQILQNPDITKSFFRYLTGKSTSVGIETALTGDEKKTFQR